GRGLGSDDAARPRVAEDGITAASRVIPVGLRAAPIATLGLLVAWSAADALSIRAPGATIPALQVLLVGVGLLVGAYVFRRPWLRPIGLTALLLAYVATHVFYLGVQLVAALVFVVLLMSHVELRILAGRFAHLYEAALSSADRSEEHTSELQSRVDLVCRLLLEKKKMTN